MAGQTYPFAALVGLDQLKTALVLNAICPAIGGVLIRGEKGTAKSTAARALRDILPALPRVQGCPFQCDPASIWPDCPHCAPLTERVSAQAPVPFVELPLGATEDRVLGTLDFERALREGRRAFQPGLLAQAHRGILYIDEVNLLADHLVDVLLDAAAMGISTVEREGMAVTHPARFLLVGTLNPEEGDLRPQLLDRFGLMVQIVGSRDPSLRSLVVRRRLDYESDPAAFQAQWHGEQQALRERIALARAELPKVQLEDGLVHFISQICCKLDVDGMRGDLVMNKTARALAAWGRRHRVTLEDIRAAAELVLPHRRRRKPFERPEMNDQHLDDLFNQQSAVDPASQPDSSPGTMNGAAGVATKDQVFAPAPSRGAGRIEVMSAAPALAPGRRNAGGEQEAGRYVRAAQGARGGSLAVDATVRAAVARGGMEGGKLDIRPEDLHSKVREAKAGTFILFVVDSSSSMAARRRMELVKGTVLALLRDAYEQRDQVGVIAFRGVTANLLLAPTRSVARAEQALHELPTGGRTPLAHALVMAQETLAMARQANPGLAVLMVVLTDGKANVPLPNIEGDSWAQALTVAAALAEARTTCLVLDSETGFIRLGRAGHLAQALGGECLALEGLALEDLIIKIRPRQW